MARIRVYGVVMAVLATMVSSGSAQMRVASGRLAPVTGWQARGIGGGGALFSPTMSPYDVDEIYMATDMTSVFRTTDFGHHWEVVHFSKLQGGIESQVRFTSDPEVLYAINLADDLRVPVKSSDGGLTWNVLPGDPSYSEAYSLWADPDSTERLLLASYSELYISDDGGSSFRQVYQADDYHVGGVLFLGDDIFVGARDGLLVSDDGGATFALAGVAGIPGDQAIVSMAGASEGGQVRLFAVTLGSGDVYPQVTGSDHTEYRSVYRLDWGGGSGWTSVTSGLGATAHPFFVAMSDADIDTVWLAGGDGATYFPIVYRSTNGGGGWVSVLQTAGNGNVTTGWSGSGGDHDWWYGEYALGFAVSPVDAERAVITDLGFVHVTADGGASWSQAYVHPDDENPAGNPTPQGRSYRGVGMEDTSVWHLHWANQETLVAGFSDIHGIRSSDGGISWAAGTSLDLPHNSTYSIVEHPTTGTLYGATSSVHDLYQSTYLQDSRIDGGEGHLVSSGDDGASWQLLHDFGHPVVGLAFDPADSDSLYASVVHSSTGGIYVTNDLDLGGAATWTRLAEPPRTEGHPLTILVLADGTLVATYSGRRDGSGAFTESSGVFVSSNGGATWQDRSHQNMTRWTKDLVVDPHDPTQSTFYVAVFSHWGSAPNEIGGLYRTFDRGQSWDRISDLYRVESCTVHPDDPDLLYLTTETEGLWSSSNLTSLTPDFEPVSDYPIRQPLRVFFNPYDHREIWVTSFGGGLRVSLATIFVDGFESGDTAAWSAK